MAEKMKAQVFYEAEKMELEERPVPRVSNPGVSCQTKQHERYAEMARSLLKPGGRLCRTTLT